MKPLTPYYPARDPQEAVPVEACPVCGREVYGPGGCGYCPVRME